LLALLASWLLVSAVRAAEWPDRQQIGRISYFADFSLASSYDLVRESESLQSQVPLQLALAGSDEPIRVFLFHDQRTYRRYLQHYFPDIPTRRAIYIKQRGPGMVFAYQSRDLAVDLRHETTHAVLHTLLPMVPLWLDEGLAEYFEVPSPLRYAGNPHLKPVQRNLRRQRFPELARLESLHDLAQMDADAYRDAWSWAHFLIHGPGEARDEFHRYLMDLQAHVPPGQLSDRLRASLPRLRSLFVQHFQTLEPRQ
jgi:hypothetical protein